MKKEKAILVMVQNGVQKLRKVMTEYMSFLQEYQDNGYKLILYHTYSNIRFLKKYKITFDEYIQDTVYYRKDPHCTKNWKYFVENSPLIKSDIAERYDIEMACVFSNILSNMPGFTRGSKTITARTLYESGSNKLINFASIGRQYHRFLVFGEFARMNKIHINEFTYDPDELSYDLIYKPEEVSHNLYFIYDIPKYNMKRIDAFQYYFLTQNNLEQHNIFFDEEDEKKYDFVLGFTISAKKRMFVYDIIKYCINQFPQNRVKIFKKVKGEEEKSLIARDDYLKYISLARFTLILPAYDATTFSGIRFIESIANNCLPLVYDKCEYTDFVNSFNIDEEKWNEILIDENSDISKISEEKRVQLLQYFKDKVLIVEKKIW